MTKELLQQALDLLSEIAGTCTRDDDLPDGILTRIDALQALAQQEQRINVPAAHELAKEQAKTDQTVTTEYLAWLESLYPARNGVGGNEAWNAGIAWFKAQQAQPAQEPVLTAIYPEKWEPCSPPWLDRGGNCDKAPRLWNASTREHWHPIHTHPAPIQPAQDAFAVVPRTMILEDADLRFLHALSQPDEEDGSFSPIALTVGDGHTGHGLYATLAEYPEEGADIICKFASPTQPALSDDDLHRLWRKAETTISARSNVQIYGRLIEAHCRGGVTS